MSRAATGAAIALALGLGGPATAHDFWIQPDVFHLEPGRSTPMTLQVGHGAERQRSLIPLGRILRFSAKGTDSTSVDLRPNLRLGGERADGIIRLPAPGAYVLVLETDNRARSRLSADRFDAYAREEGLTPAVEALARGRGTAPEVSERYSRVAKSVVQVGVMGAQTAATQVLGLSLEIVPEVSPYAEPRPQTLSVRAYREGRLLPGALVKLTDLQHDNAPLAARVTDAAGRASFPMPGPGAWRLSLVWTAPLAPADDADFETVFSSLSFGVRSLSP